MLKIAICDDVMSICAELEKILIKIGQTTNQEIEVDVFYSGEELCNYISNNNYYDLIFLDIELSIMNGVEVGKKIREVMPDVSIQIVYISAKESYAMQLFKIRPLDFIIKPITYEKISDVMNVVLKLMQKNNKFFNYKIGFETYKVNIKDILYFESNYRKVNIITKTGINSFYENLDSVFEKVKQFNFLNIHKSYLVNYDYVIKFEYDKLTMFNNKILPISQSRRKEIREIQMKLIRDESGS